MTSLRLLLVAIPLTFIFSASTPTPMPSSSGGPLSEPEGKTLRREFVRAQKNQRVALDHRLKAELREFDQAQKAAYREREAKEKADRRAYFKENLSGPVRRDYVKRMIERREEFAKLQKEARELKKKEHEDRRQVLKEEQSKGMQQLETALANKERPDPSIWPPSGG